MAEAEGCLAMNRGVTETAVVHRPLSYDRQRGDAHAAAVLHLSTAVLYKKA